MTAHGGERENTAPQSRSAFSVGKVGVLLAGAVALALCGGTEPGAEHCAGQPLPRTGPGSSPVSGPAEKPPGGKVKDIRLLNQHFNEPGADTAPWMFVPRANIKELSSSEHPGLVTLWEAGKGQDIKGLLKDPIRIDDYPLPWQFQLGMIPSFNAQVGIGGKPQADYAIGLNVAVTSSAPAPWPRARPRRPPDTHDVQLLVVHLGVTGEAGVGLPQYVRDPYPSGDSYWVWGRGDLDHKATGDWQVPYLWVGDGSKYAGPASQRLFFRCLPEGPTPLGVGIRFEAHHGWNTRRIDCSSFGKVTGVWEVGPIISADRWIPDVLCRNLPVRKGAYPIFAGRVEGGKYREDYAHVNAPKPLPPDPAYEYYVDYCTFSHVMLNTGNNAPSLEHYSEDFNIPGYTGSYGLQEQSVRGDTYSNPGYYTLTLMGPDLGTGFGPGGFLIDFDRYRPPFEIETCFRGPEDTSAWNWALLLDVYGGDGKPCGRWFPGVANDPKKKRHSYFDLTKKHLLKIEFDPEVPEEVLAHRPLHMLW